MALDRLVGPSQARSQLGLGRRGEPASWEQQSPCSQKGFENIVIDRNAYVY